MLYKIGKIVYHASADRTKVIAHVVREDDSFDSTGMPSTSFHKTRKQLIEYNQRQLTIYNLWINTTKDVIKDLRKAKKPIVEG